jgi:hypothetical protein
MAVMNGELAFPTKDQVYEEFLMVNAGRYSNARFSNADPVIISGLLYATLQDAYRELTHLRNASQTQSAARPKRRTEE